MKGVLLAFASMLLMVPAAAQEVMKEDIVAEPSMTMHGEPKYGADFAHFDYVNPNAPKGGTLKLSAHGSFDSLNPFIVKGVSASGLYFLGSTLLYQSLMTQSYDEPFSMYGALAESAERDPGNQWIIFNLRPEAKWHDGRPVSADDVKWTFETVMEKGLPFFKAYFGDVETVEVLGPRRVKFTFKHAGNAELPLILSQLTILPKHYWTSEGRDFAATTLTPPLGSGPYKISSVDPGQSITYVRVENWWGKDFPVFKGQFNFNSINYTYFLDETVRLEALFSNQYDWRDESSQKVWMKNYDVPAVKDGRIIKEEVEHGRPAGMQAFFYNIRKPLFQDVRVREALSYAFDFEWSNKQFAFDSYIRTDSYFENSELASNGLPKGKELEVLEKYRDKLPASVFTKTYVPPKTDGSGRLRKNLAKAAELLENAGYTLGSDGVRVHKETGQRLAFEIVDQSPLFQRWVLPFIENLKRIGVEASFRVLDTAQYQNRIENFDFDMTISSILQSRSPGNEQRDFWNSVKADMIGSRNIIGIKDPVIDAMVEDIINAPSREDLVARTRALDRVLLANFYVIPHWHYNKWRMAYWTHLKRPETLSDSSPLVTTTWWHKDAE